MTMKPSNFWAIITVLSALGVGWFTWLDIESTLRPLLAFWFLLVCPGMAYVQLLHLKSTISRWMLAIALSIAINTLVSEILVLSNLWSADWGLAIVIVISLFGLSLQLFQARRHCGTTRLWPNLNQPERSSVGDLKQNCNFLLTTIPSATGQANLDETQQALYLDLVDRLKTRIAQVEATTPLNRQQYDEILAHQNAIDQLYNQLLSNLNSIDRQRQIQAERVAAFQAHMQWRIDFARAVESHKDHAFALYCYQMAETSINDVLG